MSPGAKAWTHGGSPPLPAHFRKLPPGERQDWFQAGQKTLDADFAHSMVENSAGFMEVPLGIVPAFPLNGVQYHIPLATEEPSVVAAASYGARIVSRSGTVQAWSAEPRMRGQIFLEDSPLSLQVAREILANRLTDLELVAAPYLESMKRRGGGLAGFGVEQHPESQVLELWFEVLVKDAMGANLINTLAEALSPLAQELFQGRKLMAILSNQALGRLSGARFSIPLDHLARGGFSGAEAARRMEKAALLAREDSWRALTHNKGIMNGISALALATGNDTRALEAAVHAYAARDGQYRALSRYRVEEDHLVAELELPLALAVVGGATAVHPRARRSLEILGQPSARELSALAAGLGLVQNFAALWALVSEGIQKGHMALHAQRLNHQEKKG